MVYQKGVGKLQPRWRGPFKIVGYVMLRFHHPKAVSTPLFVVKEFGNLAYSPHSASLRELRGERIERSP